MAVWNSVSITLATEADRIDAEYFDPTDLETVGTAKKQGFVRLDIVCTPLHGKPPGDYVEDGLYQVVRAGDLVFPLIYPDCGAPFLRTHAEAKLFFLKKGDVLISSIGMGSIGKVSFVMDATNLVTVPEVTIPRNATVAPEFLFYYLRTPLGQGHLLREVTGATGQQHLSKEKAGRVLVPPVPDGLSEKLEELCRKIWKREQELARLRATGPGLLSEQIPLAGGH